MEYVTLSQPVPIWCAVVHWRRSFGQRGAASGRFIGGEPDCMIHNHRAETAAFLRLQTAQDFREVKRVLLVRSRFIMMKLHSRAALVSEVVDLTGSPTSLHLSKYFRLACNT